jgi:hypothetical protein
MPPRTRNPREKATPVTTTETAPENVDAETDAEPAETPEAAQRRDKVSPDAAEFLEGFTISAPPKLTRPGREYVPSAYDEVVAQSWQRYVNEGSQPWSQSGEWADAKKPAGGWWSDRDDIYVSTVVPDVNIAESLIRRAAQHLGISFRLRYRFEMDETTNDKGEPVKVKRPIPEETGGFRIWFTAAPVLKQSPKDE